MREWLLASSTIVQDKGRVNSEVDQSSEVVIKRKKHIVSVVGEVGHFVVDCNAELCDNCLKPCHKTDVWLLLTMLKTVVTTYGRAALD